jgi:DNA replication and repair protein RecF
MDEVAAISAIELSYLQLKNFRCFGQLQLTFESPYVLLTGANGVGKTSILEALHYMCYLRSFRTHSPRELITAGSTEFFVKIQLNISASATSHAIQVGFSHNKRLVKIDQKPVVSYKELMTYYRIVSITESDLALVQDGPYSRRLFLDQTLLFLDEEYAQMLKTYRRIVDQRNALLQQHSPHQESYVILTQQLWHASVQIDQRRRMLLDQLIVLVNRRGTAFIDQFSPLQFVYCPRALLMASFDEFYQKYKRLFEQEQRFGRTLFGPHLDDVTILFGQQSSRIFASRGQQKLIVLLIKMAQLELLSARGIAAICILDDFMTDFDEKYSLSLLDALRQLGTQLIFTNPLSKSLLADRLQMLGAQVIKLTT